jgi:hypothetical protein
MPRVCTFLIGLTGVSRLIGAILPKMPDSAKTSPKSTCKRAHHELDFRGRGGLEIHP